MGIPLELEDTDTDRDTCRARLGIPVELEDRDTYRARRYSIYTRRAKVYRYL